jgi:hypothetical protein
MINPTMMPMSRNDAFRDIIVPRKPGTCSRAKLLRPVIDTLAKPADTIHIAADAHALGIKAIKTANIPEITLATTVRGFLPIRLINRPPTMTPKIPITEAIE